MTDYRKEHDLLGDRDIPAAALHGIHTERAIENFPLARRPVHSALVHAYGAVKLACARTNHELGRWDLKILADYYRKHPGALNVRQEDASDPLYSARVTAVEQFLGSNGVDLSRMTVENTLPPGEGMAAWRVQNVLEQGNSPRTKKTGLEASEGIPKALSPQK